MTWSTLHQPAGRPVQLSDGSLVVLQASTGGLFTIQWSSDRSTFTTVASGVAANASSKICTDGSDNLYVTNSTAGTIQAFVNTGSHTWFAVTPVAVTSWVLTAGQFGTITGEASSTYLATTIDMFWSSVGGSGSAGQLVIAELGWRSASGTSVAQIMTYDAGQLLGGHTPVAYQWNSHDGAGKGPGTGSGSSGFIQSLFTAAIMDGFGGPGIWVVGPDGGGGSGSLRSLYFEINSSGPLLIGDVLETGWASSSVDSVVGDRYAAGAVVVMQGGYLCELSSTGTIYPATALWPGTSTGDATYVSSTHTLWVYTLNTSTSQLTRTPVTPGSTPTAGAGVTEQTEGTTWGNGSGVVLVPPGFALSRFAVGQIDYDAYSTTAWFPGTWGGLTVYAAAPSAATLLGPANGAYIDVTSGATLTAVYNSTDGAAANAYALRIKTSSGAYQYYNTSTGLLGSSIVWNTVTVAPGASLGVTLASGLLTNGNTYNWSIAFQESLGNLQGSFATDFVFSAQPAPTLMITGPTGTSTTSTPIVTWTATPASGLTITGYEVIVESGPYGTTPGSGMTVWDSTFVTPNIGQAQVGVDLANDATYRAFVQVTETHGTVSVWQHVDLSIVYDQPAAPMLAASPDFDPVTGAPRVAVAVQGADNIISLLDASFEGTAGTWTASGATIAASTTKFLDGSFSGKVVATASGSPSGATGHYNVAPGAQYTILGSFLAGSAARACTVGVTWYDSGGSAIRTDTSTTVTDNTTTWAQAAITVTSPSGAATAIVRFGIASVTNTEIHYLDQVGLFPGTTTAWSRGGLPGTTTVSVTRYDPDNPTGIAVRNGINVTIPTPSQLVTVLDYEAPIGVACAYTATTTATV